MTEWIQIQQTIGAVLITAMVTVTLVTWAVCLVSGAVKKKKKKKPLYVTEILDFTRAYTEEAKAAEERREKLMKDWKEGKI